MRTGWDIVLCPQCKWEFKATGAEKGSFDFLAYDLMPLSGFW